VFGRDYFAADYFATDYWFGDGDGAPAEAEAPTGGVAALLSGRHADAEREFEIYDEILLLLH